MEKGYVVGDRGCGKRTLGGAYLEVRLIEGGAPWELFMVDPVREVPEGMDIPDRGVAIIERVVEGKQTGIFDVYDKIGRKHYPNVVDFMFEARKKGISRRISSGTDFSLLSKNSLLVLLHDHAIVDNAHELYRHIKVEMAEMTDAHHWHCPCKVSGHDSYPQYAALSEDMMPTCIGALNEVVEGGEEIYDPNYEPRSVRREVGDLKYLGRHAPIGFRPGYETGIFMVLPISNIAVIKDPVSHKDLQVLERASQSSLDVLLEDE